MRNDVRDLGGCGFQPRPISTDEPDFYAMAGQLGKGELALIAVGAVDGDEHVNSCGL